ncbi:MAG: hypothetical protein ACW98D_19445 [Promethearchaeota archaeon]|jgi:hypothetical protein
MHLCSVQNGISRTIIKRIASSLLFSICLATILFNFTFCGEANNKEELIQKATLEELRLHSKAQLVDIYKFFFQDSFGPGHIISDQKSALTYLQNELQSSMEFDSVLWQQVGYKNRFYRINLILVKDGVIPEEKYFNAFIQSAETFKNPTIKEWREEWNFIFSVINEMKLTIPNYKEDKASLDKMLLAEKVLVRHSDIYRKFYHPHYRIVDKENFEKLNLD